MKRNDKYKEINQWLEGDRKNPCEVTKNWQLEDWEEYLKSIDGPPQGKLLEPQIYQYLADIKPPFFSQLSSPDYEVNQKVENALALLNPKQRSVIEKLFYECLSERETGQELGMKRGSVRDRKKAALKRIESFLSGGTPTQPIMQGAKSPQKDIFDEIEEKYWEGVISDGDFYHLWALAEVGGLKAGDLS